MGRTGWGIGPEERLASTFGLHSARDLMRRFRIVWCRNVSSLQPLRENARCVPAFGAAVPRARRLPTRSCCAVSAVPHMSSHKTWTGKCPAAVPAFRWM